MTAVFRKAFVFHDTVHTETGAHHAEHEPFTVLADTRAQVAPNWVMDTPTYKRAEAAREIIFVSEGNRINGIDYPPHVGLPKREAR
jgi:hypothetical protein